MIRRKEVIGDTTLYLGDCLEILPELGGFDACVTDPPYGVGLKVKSNDFRDSRFYDAGKSMAASQIYDDTPEKICFLIQKVMPLILKVSPRAGIFCGHRLLHDYPKPTSIGCVFISNGAGRDPWGFGCFNPILYYGKCPYLAHGRGSRPNAFADNQPNLEKIDHPCPKPLPWMLWLVKRVSLEKESVLDPFMGSGTTGVACVKLGRRFTGIEIHEPYFDVACRRVEDAYRQRDLFIPPPAHVKPEQMSMEAL